MLNDLFEEILHSEKDYKEKIEKYRALNEKLDDCQKQLLIVQKDNEFLEGEVLVKQQTLSDLRVEICRWSARQKELERQKRKLQEEVASLEASAQLLEQHGDRERKAFIEMASEFTNQYGLHVDHKRKREEREEQEQAALEEEMALLKAETEEAQRQDVEVSSLSVQLKECSGLLSKEKDIQNQLVLRLDGQAALLKRAEEEQKCQLSFTQSNPEFLQLQEELVKCNPSALEERCKELKKQFELVQKEYYTRKWMATRSTCSGKQPQMNASHKPSVSMVTESNIAEDFTLENCVLDSLEETFSEDTGGATEESVSTCYPQPAAVPLNTERPTKFIPMSTVTTSAGDSRRPTYSYNFKAFNNNPSVRARARGSDFTSATQLFDKGSKRVRFKY